MNRSIPRSFKDIQLEEIIQEIFQEQSSEEKCNSFDFEGCVTDSQLVKIIPEIFQEQSLPEDECNSYEIVDFEVEVTDEVK